MATIFHPPDTLVTAFIERETHVSAITLADLQRIAKAPLGPSGVMVVEDPVYTVVTWRPFAGAGISDEDMVSLGLG